VRLVWNNFSLDFSAKTCIMGILNVTPDSFSDAGVHFDAERAVDRAFRMVEEGADIIDIGGESTRPGSDPLPAEEELRRTVPVIEKLATGLKIPLSIDTYKAEIARRALDAGASIVNDISGARFDPDMPKVLAEYKVPVVLMHIRGNPKSMQVNPTYAALIPEIIDSLKSSVMRVLNAGVREEMIIIDPGIGFGKTFEHNLAILNNLDAFAAMGRPLLVGPSRKAFLGKILGGAPPHERVEGTAAAVAISIMKGANIIRVHDVKEMAKVARVADAIRRERIT
jgi:dihydropteroate synthase